MTEDELKQVAAFYESPLGKKFEGVSDRARGPHRDGGGELATAVVDGDAGAGA